MAAPEFWIVAGPNGAGKTTCVQKEPISGLLPDIAFSNPDDRTLAKLRAFGFQMIRLHNAGNAPWINCRGSRNAPLYFGFTIIQIPMNAILQSSLRVANSVRCSFFAATPFPK
jgi:hypothetical protein